ncbi:uncharacterized protein LOC111013954 [Momordica charantia]|uniref:Uncharacterized protein LOC111013954 n=1 Tax=Momordica charantia TaxID=3673 RepID=A0A6J1CSM4_MOMCH|nr:uncharacterized protein LOC111013954 [Momordica charantia]
MTPRAYVLIFFFWSFLTILTPALVLLSENSKSPPPSFDSPDGKNGGINMSRKVVGLTRKYEMLKVLAEEQKAPTAIPIPVTVPVPSPSPAPAPDADFPVRRFMAGAGKVILTTLKVLKEA